MPRTARMIVKGEDAIYHIISKTTLTGYVLGDIEKDYLFNLIKWMSEVFFVEVFGFCIMGNHFHLLVKMENTEDYTDEELKSRLALFFRKDNRIVTDGQLPYFRKKLSNLSEYMKEIKQRFTRYYNKAHNKTGYFWGDRFKSVLLESGDTLINCLAYIDLNPVRANIVTKPEDYRWSSIGYHMQSGNKDSFLSTDLGLMAYNEMNEKERFTDYREFLYEKGGLDTKKGASINEDILAKERGKHYELTAIDRLRFKTRYFTDSGIIGTKGFVVSYYEMFKNNFGSKDKIPKKITGLAGVYSLKRLSNELTLH